MITIALDTNVVVSKVFRGLKGKSPETNLLDRMNVNYLEVLPFYP